MSTFAKYNNKLINLACAKCIMIDVDLYFQQTNNEKESFYNNRSDVHLCTRTCVDILQ